MKTNKSSMLVAIFALTSTLLFTGCIKPPKIPRVEQIGPNETAWLIPLDGASKDGQVKFDSIKFLEAKKVSAKRVTIDQVEQKIGRWDYDIKWIDAALLIKVDRSLVTREWTDNKDPSSTRISQGIKVVTRDSIRLTVGLTITANIEEEDASTYLYYHGQKPLADVVDQNVRSFAVAELTRQYSEMELTEAQKEGPKIYSKLFDDAAKAFKLKGITIQFLGNAEGMHYDEAKVQTAINQKFIAEQDRQTAMQEQEATKIRNATKILGAQAQADAAGKLFEAQKASEFQNQLEILKMTAEAKLEMAKRWNGQLPANILPSDSPLLLNLGADSKPTASTPAVK